MNRTAFFIALVGVSMVAAASFASMSPDEPIVLKPDDIVWRDRDSGVRIAILQGDPSRPGPFTLRLRYPAGYRKEPHYHPKDAYVTVLSGSYSRGYGNTFDMSKGITLTPGTFSVNPAQVSHYEWTTEPAEIQVTAVGPWESVYVDAQGNALPAGGN